MLAVACLTHLLAAALCPVWASEQVTAAEVGAGADTPPCEMQARTTAGWVCGTRRRASNGDYYASFRGVPYAKQPLGDLRFKELEPPEKWSGILDASKEGPICPQTDVFYGKLVYPARQMSEACIHANIHVPASAGDLMQWSDEHRNKTGLPILVFIHGGGFAFGSGDADLHGPEYLVSKGVIVITFNYRLNVFGFLSLDSPLVPGNNGIRDARTLLRWVRDNAARFGGDAARLTLAGQSAGGAIAHVLSLAPDAPLLMARVMVLSGTGFSDFFSSSPVFARIISGQLLGMLGINPAQSPAEVHQQLVKTPLEKIMEANAKLIDIFGLTTFTPVVESVHEGVTPVLVEDPEVLISRGRGRCLPLVVGYTSAECESFRPRFEAIDVLSMFRASPQLLVSPRLTFMAPTDKLAGIFDQITEIYFNKSINMDSFVQYCSDAYYMYPAMKLAMLRQGPAAASTTLYRFAAAGHHSPLKEAFGISFEGTGHVEDITYMFRPNAALAARPARHALRDLQLVTNVTDFVVQFMSAPAENCARLVQTRVHGAVTAREWRAARLYANIHAATRAPARAPALAPSPPTPRARARAQPARARALAPAPQ